MLKASMTLSEIKNHEGSGHKSTATVWKANNHARKVYGTKGIHNGASVSPEKLGVKTWTNCG